MKISEAILLGSMVTEPHTGSRHITRLMPDRTMKDFACALGAIEVATGMWTRESGLKQLAESVIPGLNREVAHPARVGKYGMATVIVSLNDQWLWSRERIAEWVAGVEKGWEEEAAPATPVGAEAVCV